jgi:5,10-methylenetetrahydromethanopterin reductase
LPQFEGAGGLQGYAAVAQAFEPPDARYLHNHRGHLMFVKPEERPFLTADLVRASSMTGAEADIRERIGSLRDAGYTQFTIQLVPGQEDAIIDWARIKAAFA